MRPAHVAVVMDGNGRWAKQRHLPRTIGHQRGRRAVRRLIEAAHQLGVPYLTIFAFSSENWSRPAAEVDALMRLFLKALQRDIDEMHRNGVRLRFIGDCARFSPALQSLMQQAEARTAENRQLFLQVAVSYGGQWDILQAVRSLMASGDALPADDAALRARFEVQLATAPCPPVDLFIRTGGEQRISNFLLWQLAYAELYFTDCLWPDFDRAAFETALAWFAHRQRRFGGVIDD
ncbi:polyprenyl diphosphate synthase [Halothiobacillus sp. DCM-1]